MKILNSCKGPFHADKTDTQKSRTLRFLIFYSNFIGFLFKFFFCENHKIFIRRSWRDCAGFMWKTWRDYCFCRKVVRLILCFSFQYYMIEWFVFVIFGNECTFDLFLKHCSSEILVQAKTTRCLQIKLILI